MGDVLYQPFPMQGLGRAQVWQFAPEYRRPRHFHAEPELNLVCAGSGVFGSGARQLEVSAGDLLWWPPGVDHELLETSAGFELYVVGLTPELSERVLGAGLVIGAARRVRLAGAALAHLRAACLLPTTVRDAAVVERHVAELWLAAHACGKAAVDTHSLTRRALASLWREPELTRSELARAAHPSEVSRHFRHDTGLTLTEYRTRLRLLRFIGAVDGSARNLLSAACSAGFGSYSQCHRAFRSAFGCTPRTFFSSNIRRQLSDTFAPW